MTANVLALAPRTALRSPVAMPADGPAERPKPVSEEARLMGRALKALRERLGLSQQAAADLSKVTKTAWQNYENGRSVILRTDLQARLARAIGSDRRELLLQLAAITPAGERSSLSGFGMEEPSGPADPFIQRAVFPLREGDVVVNFPTDLSAESFDQLESYLTTFLKARRPANDQ